MKINKDLIAASATPIVLSLLREGESYGYAIIQRVRELSDGEVQWTDGMLYPILHRLEAQGLIEARWGESESGRKRRYYRMKPAARDVLEEERRQWSVMNLVLAKVWEAQGA
ncbi:MAG: helix-turn-helix transcriptional regulator [Verrucomicrobiae bacterium]|nr:helix-turn-helix transcriptional regulator [Verrucomicrobiae bacterium]